MGLGDNIMATGMARGARARGKRIAFGDGRRIIWDQNSAEIFQHNPNVAPPGAETLSNLEWIPFHKGHRIYNKQDGSRWIWNYEFHPVPGEIFLDHREKTMQVGTKPGFVLIEPNVPWYKPVAPNKDWGFFRYQEVANALLKEGHDVAQFSAGRDRLAGVRTIQARTFRLALAALARASLVICPEGGLHHGAAAMGVRAVVLFGGFIPPQVTGYETHANLTGGAEACGSHNRCEHCRAAMDRISVDEVVDASKSMLSKAA